MTASDDFDAFFAGIDTPRQFLTISIILQDIMLWHLAEEGVGVLGSPSDCG